MTRALLIAAMLAGCYNPPEPDCGFVCGPGGACPTDYTCADDHRCHRDGTASLACATDPDAGVGAAPHVLSTMPSNAMQGVAVDVYPTAIVDQDLLGVTDQTFYVLQDTDPILGHADYQPASKQPRFIPDMQLYEYSFYRVVIGTGITNVTGQPLAPLQWTFITGADTAPPHVHSTMPASSAGNVSTSTHIEIVFDETITGVDATNFTVDAGGPVAGSLSPLGTMAYTFAPAALLPSGTLVTVTLGTGIQDVKGNAFAGYSYSFTTQ